MIDGERSGVIRNGKDLTLQVDPGRHHVRLRYYWCSSQVLEVDPRVGETVELACRPISPDNPFAIFYRMLFARTHYMELSLAHNSPPGSNG